MKALGFPTEITPLKKEIDRLFERIWEDDWAGLAKLGEWRPAIEVSETEDSVIVKAEVPGIDRERVHVSVQNDVLMIKGEKREEKEEKKARFYRMERTYGTFARAVPLPSPVDPERAVATFRDGVLTVTMPRVTPMKGTTIPVTTAP